MKNEPENYQHVRGVTGRAMIVNLLVIAALVAVVWFGPSIWSLLFG